ARTLFRGKTKLVRASTHPTVVFRNRNELGHDKSRVVDLPSPECLQQFFHVAADPMDELNSACARRSGKASNTVETRPRQTGTAVIIA
ncbi:MAG: hypothetical protein JW959_03265, partial [Pirellulales bacterium]|nr:hypothetical protein [Pirellulales bacterium]